MVIHVQNNVGIHLDETAVAVVGKAFVARSLSQAFDCFVIQTEVQDGVHHARHGNAGAGTHGEQQRVFRIGEFAADNGFAMGDAVFDLFGQIGGEGLAVFIEIRADFGRYRKSRRNGNADRTHFRQVGTLAAQQVLVGSMAFGFAVAKFINPFCHGFQISP